jgi:hypothetical protein
MKKPTIVLTILLLSLIAYAPFRAEAQFAPGTWNLVLSPAAGGTKTAVSLSNSGELSTGYIWGSGGGVLDWMVGASGNSGAPAGAWSFATTNFTVSPFGYATNFTTGASRSFTQFNFWSFGGESVAAGVGLDGVLTATTGDQVAFIVDPSPAQFEIDLAFSNFTPGTYNTTPSTTSPNYNMEIVPEPSTYALLALSAAGLGGYVLRRRRH